MTTAIEVVGIAGSGEQAIADVERLKPDLLTLDMQLPGMDGLEVVERLMADSPLPIVVLSGAVAKGSERAAEALAAGALEILPKDRLRLDVLDDVWAEAMRSRLRRLSSMRVDRPRRAQRVPRRRRGRIPHRALRAAPWRPSDRRLDRRPAGARGDLRRAPRGLPGAAARRPAHGSGIHRGLRQVARPEAGDRRRPRRRRRSRHPGRLVRAGRGPPAPRSIEAIRPRPRDGCGPPTVGGRASGEHGAKALGREAVGGRAHRHGQ